MRCLRALPFVVVAPVALAVVAGLSLDGCSCGAPPAPPQLPGQGTPIGAPDAGDPDVHDSGPLVCVDDADEPNDTRDAATPATSGTAIDAVACGGNDDWYAIATNVGCDVDAHVVEKENVGADAGVGGPGGLQGNVGILLFDPDGQLVASSTGFDADKDVHVSAVKDGNYALRIRAGARDDVPYEVTLTSTCATDLTCPADDALEPDDGPTQLARLTTGVPTEGILCGTNEDWFLVPVTQGCIADNRVDFDTTQGDIDVEMRLADGVTTVGFSDGSSNEERIDKVVTGGGMMLRVHFFTPDANAANAYHVVSNEICLGAISCPSDDPFEPNNDIGSATPLFAALDESIGAICGNDDFFSLQLTQGCTLHAVLSFVDAEGDLDLELDDASGNFISSSATTNDTETIDFQATGNDGVFLRVTGFNGANNTYRLHVEQQNCQ